MEEGLDENHKLEMLKIVVTDDPTKKLGSHFGPACAFIDKKLSTPGGAVLAHCAGGVSRSATIVIAYLMWKFSLPFKEAIELCQTRRQRINPNRGFRAELQVWEKTIFS